ncbi:hypothetical protein FSC37_22765 [Piscinibacter aquaticus]|uniref:Uncharacterized protein n=1 Tax=Piscinibacter aquaticus TaxID=392597 RepID=A0A5C6TPH9_9BURK|nr:hypothetical protein FSC37_22765 [Piscinibacter aquaticus]
MVFETLRRGNHDIGAAGMLHLPAFTALARQSESVRFRETIYQLIGSVQFPDMRLKVGSVTGYREAILGHRSQPTSEPFALYRGLLAPDASSTFVPSIIAGLGPA